MVGLPTQHYIIGRMEYTVFAGNLETTEVVVAADAHLEMVEGDKRLVALYLQSLVLRTEAMDLFQTVGKVQRLITEATTYGS